MKAISKQDFSAFVDALIQDSSMDVQGVVAKGEKFVFGPLDSAGELRLDYDVTILPPKKYFLPQYETMMKYDTSKPYDVQKEVDAPRRVLLGVHPYDIAGIMQMDKYFLDVNVDDAYVARRKNTVIVGLTPQNVSEKAFYGDMVLMGPDGQPPELAFDIMLTDIGDSIVVIPKTEAGQALLAKAPNLRDATPEETQAQAAKMDEAMGKAKRGLKVGPKGWHDLLSKNYESEVWKEMSDKCLSCGSCTLVCPTCFCYDVQDELNLDMTTGVRTRTWDGCLLRDFTKVGSGEYFRESKEARYRHRFNRKGKYLPDALGFVACVGCGRCASGCIPDIADPVGLFNKLAETTTAQLTDAPIEMAKGDVATASADGALYVPMPATLKRVEKMTDNETLFELELDSGQPLGHQPGQFVEVSILGVGEAPISISSAPGGTTFQLVVRNVGDVTGALHGMKVGDKLGIRGPFGTGFDTEGLKGKNLIFVGGGLGVVPMRSFINYVLNNRADYGEVTILYGCKEPSEMLFKDELKDWETRDDVQYKITVDTCPENEDWQGNIGVITTIMPLVTFDPVNTVAVVVGPPIMYRFVNRDLLNMGMPPENIIVSLERRMKCGVGKCGHCQINGIYVCKEGPVFNYKDIQNLPEAFS